MSQLLEQHNKLIENLRKRDEIIQKLLSSPTIGSATTTTLSTPTLVTSNSFMKTRLQWWPRWSGTKRRRVTVGMEVVRATLPLQFLVLKLRSSGSRTIHARDNPHKGWDASGGVAKILRTPVGCPSST